MTRHIWSIFQDLPVLHPAWSSLTMLQKFRSPKRLLLWQILSHWTEDNNTGIVCESMCILCIMYTGFFIMGFEGGHSPPENDFAPTPEL